jgi:hypothetical protein
MFVYLISSVDIIACNKCRLSGDHDEMVSDRKWPPLAATGPRSAELSVRHPHSINQ